MPTTSQGWKAINTLPDEEGKLYIRFYAHFPQKYGQGDMEMEINLPLAPEQKQALEALIRAVRESGEYSLPLFGGKTTNYHWLDWGLDDPDRGGGANEG